MKMKNRTIQKVNKRQTRKKAKVINVLEEIKKNYNRKEEGLVAELKMSYRHDVTIGSFREQVWANLFRQLLPKKFSIHTNGFIIGVDSLGEAIMSPEIDIIIFDEYYVPYIFQFGETAKIIPIEAVIAVVQCKSSQIGNADEWLSKIDCIKPSVKSAQARQFPNKISGNEINKETNKYRKTRPLSILCGTGAINSDDFDLTVGLEECEITEEGIEKKVKKSKLIVKSKLLSYSFEDVAKYLNEEEVLAPNKSINEVWREFEQVENGILKLSLILNQLTMLINNPLIFDHPAYAKMFAKSDEKLNNHVVKE